METEQNDDRDAATTDNSAPISDKAENIITPNETNLTGTAVKTNAPDLDESEVKFYGSKKRLFASCDETIGSPAAVVGTPRYVRKELVKLALHVHCTLYYV